MISLGLDTSTKTGVVVLEGSSTSPTLLYENEITAGKDDRGLYRCSVLAGKILEVVDEYNPDVVVTEGYGFANANTLATLVEIGTVIRYMLLQRELDTFTVAPLTLKKFIIGKGKGSKDEIMLNVFKRWGHSAKTNNTADAYGLATMGIYKELNPENLIKPQIEAIAKMSNVV